MIWESNVYSAQDLEDLEEEEEEEKEEQEEQEEGERERDQYCIRHTLLLRIHLPCNGGKNLADLISKAGPLLELRVLYSIA